MDWLQELDEIVSAQRRKRTTDYDIYYGHIDESRHSTNDMHQHIEDQPQQ